MYECWRCEGIVLYQCCHEFTVWCNTKTWNRRRSCGSVVEHCVSSAKCFGFNSQGTHIFIKKCIAWMYSKSLWIKASAKCKCKMLPSPHSLHCWAFFQHGNEDIHSPKVKILQWTCILTLLSSCGDSVEMSGAKLPIKDQRGRPQELNRTDVKNSHELVHSVPRGSEQYT